MKLIKTLLVVALFVGLAIGALRGAANYRGVCRAEGRVLSNAERIRIVVEMIILKDPPVIPLKVIDETGKARIDNQQPDRFVRYTSVSEFTSLNPNCCEVVESTPEGSRASVMDRLTGRLAAYVRVRYRVRYIDQNNRPGEATVEPYYAMTNCGHPWSGI